MKLLKIGRDVGCDIVLQNNSISSLHAEITLLNSGDIMLEDKGSQNGTYVMGQRIQPGKPVKIRRGDRIAFANIELQWSRIPMPEDNSAYKAIIGIGSHFSNEIQVSGATVSRYHATIKVAKDGKIFIVDHSKNGTTVDGVKITSDNPYRIKKKSAVVCGGVPVNLNNPIIPWPKSIGKYIVGLVAAIIIIAGCGLAIPHIIGGGAWTAKEINARYSNSTVLLIGMYHFEVECGDLDPRILNAIGIPTKFYYTGDGLEPFGEDIKASAIENRSHYEASGFFIDKEGRILTNLHVAKPWLFDNIIQKVESYCRNRLANFSDSKTATALFTGHISGLSGYVSQLKIKGISDGILLIPQGAYFSSENAIRCHVLSAGEDINEDVALIQSDQQCLPNKCVYVNVKDSLDAEDEALEVGEQMFTIGFPHGTNFQKLDSENGLQAFCLSGNITQKKDDYCFMFDASSYHGASGSPIFNSCGKLIGILRAGTEKEDFNEGVQAKYIKKLLESPYKK